MYAKKRNPWLTALIVVVCLTLVGLGLFLYDTYVDRSGWALKNGTYYYKDFHGKYITGWQDIDAYRYYFGDDNAMATGWLRLEGKTYHLGTDGNLDFGWIEEDGSRFYADEQGIVQTGWQDIGTSRYYFDKTGMMYTGWLEPEEGKRYYFNEAGIMALGFADIEGNTYFFGNTGQMVTGQMPTEEGIYYFDESGVQHTGWLETRQGKSYYHPDTGYLVTGWQDVEGKHLYFDEDGLMQTGWVEQGEYRYYLLSDGTPAAGPMEIEGEKYYFTPDGIHVVLVNKDHKVPDSYEVNLVKIDSWYQVSDVCFDALRKMLDDCKAAVGYYEFNSAYRSFYDQQAILEARTQENMTDGRDYGAARAIALQTVAIPGTSEHHLGLAVDILGKDAIAWLTEHCWEYGFIVRYQAEKSHITGIANEPWHYRYVGTAVSLPMQESGLCLEEYLGAYVAPPEEETEEGEEGEEGAETEEGTESEKSSDSQG